MKLIFYDRSTAPQVGTSGDIMLTVERGGNFAFSVALVEALGLHPDTQALLAQDAETNTWYLLFGKVEGRQTFTLRPRDRKGKALQFCSQPNARTYFDAHGLDRATTRSVRALVGLESVPYQQLALFPLRPQHPTKTAAPVPPAAEEKQWQRPAPVTALAESTPEPAPATAPAATTAPVAAASEVVAPKAASVAKKYTPEQDAALLDLHNSPSELAREWGVSAAALHTRRAQLKRKAGEVPAPIVLATPGIPAAATLIYTPATAEGGELTKKTYGLQARAEELGSYWMERDLARTTPGELAEILNLLRHVPASKRGIEMSLVLDRAELEQNSRQNKAGKGGQSR